MEVTVERLLQTIGRQLVQLELKDETIAALVAERDQLAAKVMEQPANSTRQLVEAAKAKAASRRKKKAQES